MCRARNSRPNKGKRDTPLPLNHKSQSTSGNDAVLDNRASHKDRKVAGPGYYTDRMVGDRPLLAFRS